MNDGRILAADLQYYTLGGNTLDDSVMVGYRPSLPTNIPHLDTATLYTLLLFSHR